MASKEKAAEDRARKVAEGLRTDCESLRHRIARIFQGRERQVDIITSEAMRFQSLLAQIEERLGAAIIPSTE